MIQEVKIQDVSFLPAYLVVIIHSIKNIVNKKCFEIKCAKLTFEDLNFVWRYSSEYIYNTTFTYYFRKAVIQKQKTSNFVFSQCKYTTASVSWIKIIQNISFFKIQRFALHFFIHVFDSFKILVSTRKIKWEIKICKNIFWKEIFSYKREFNTYLWWTYWMTEKIFVN